MQPYAPPITGPVTDPPPDEAWVVIEDEHGRIASSRWQTPDRSSAELAAEEMNSRAKFFGIATRYHALREVQLAVVQQLMQCQRLGTDVDWRPAELLPEDYYIAS